jgi:NADPH-dependent 2,4-dienoyl-CoA reductase/sulfur reductase-like enzyme
MCRGRSRGNGRRWRAAAAMAPGSIAVAGCVPADAAGTVLARAGENALGGNRQFAGSLGTQVVKIFDQAAARTGLRDHEARAAGFDPVTVGSAADDHKAYYPGSHRITMRVTGDRNSGRLLGLQLFGHKNAEIAKRVDIAATAIFHGMTVEAVSDLDLSYTPPLGRPLGRRPGRRSGLGPEHPAALTPLRG